MRRSVKSMINGERLLRKRFRQMSTPQYLNRELYEAIHGDSDGVSDAEIKAEIERRWRDDDVPSWRG